MKQRKERSGVSALYEKALASLHAGFEPELVLACLAICAAAEGNTDPEISKVVWAGKLSLVRGEKDHRLPLGKTPAKVFARGLDVAEQIAAMRAGAGKEEPQGEQHHVAPSEEPDPQRVLQNEAASEEPHSVEAGPSSTPSVPNEE